jgi:hypothetical protein
MAQNDNNHGGNLGFEAHHAQLLRRIRLAVEDTLIALRDTLLPSLVSVENTVSGQIR